MFPPYNNRDENKTRCFKNLNFINKESEMLVLVLFFTLMFFVIRETSLKPIPVRLYVKNNSQKMEQPLLIISFNK